MIKNEKNENDLNKSQILFLRKKADLELKRQLQSSADIHITERSSDESLENLFLKKKLKGDDFGFSIEDHVIDKVEDYGYKFYKEWYHALADLYQVDRKLMENYVKPKFVAMFIIHFIYARFPYSVLKSLRKKSPLLFPGYSPMRSNKLYQRLSKSSSEQLDMFIEQCFVMMKESKSVLEFKQSYSQKYTVYFQVDLFPGEYN